MPRPTVDSSSQRPSSFTGRGDALVFLVGCAISTSVFATIAVGVIVSTHLRVHYLELLGIAGVISVLLVKYVPARRRDGSSSFIDDFAEATIMLGIKSREVARRLSYALICICALAVALGAIFAR